jgi:S1-C subfamily serine protease
VYEDSPAAKAGILPGDFVYRVNGENIEDSSDFLLRVANLPQNRAADFDIIRGGKRITLTVRIEKRGDEDQLGENSNKLWPGLSVVKINDYIQQQLDLPRRVGNLVIANVQEGSPAAIAGLKPGDIVMDVNGKRVPNAMSFYRSLNEDSTEVLFRIYREGNELIIGLV